MVTALVVSNLVLWVAVVALSLTVLALLRQVGVLHERVAPAGAMMPAAGPQVGVAAPALALRDWRDAAVQVGGAAPDRKATLILFVSPTCPLCKTMLPIVESIFRRERGWLRLVFASDGTRAEHEAFVAEQPLLRAHPYVLSADLGLTYQVGKLPYGVLIDGEGVLRGRGLVNTREHVESLFEAMERGVGSLQEYLKGPDGSGAYELRTVS